MSRILCIDIGGTGTKLGWFEAGAGCTVVTSIASRGPVEEYWAALSTAVTLELGKGASAIGVAVAGFLDHSQERLIYNPNLRWLEQFPLRARLAELARIPVWMEVDSNAAALAEYHLGAGRGSARFLCVTIGTGFGVGMVVNGEPMRFAYGCMGDPGHMIVNPEGPACSCGGRGCAELYVSAPILAEAYRLRTGATGECTLRTVIENARQGDPAATLLLEESGHWLGIACASLANTFYPDRIAIAGGYAEAGKFVFQPLRNSFQLYASTFTREQTNIVPARMGATATLTGAALPLRESLRQEPLTREVDYETTQVRL